MPNISCTAGTGAEVTINTVASTKLAQPFFITLPKNIASQTGTCTVQYPATTCQREKIETITIGDEACVPSGYTKPTCDIYLSRTRFPIMSLTESFQNLSFSGITDDCQIDELIGKNTKLQCNWGTITNLVLRTETTDTGTGLFIRMPRTYLNRDATCTLTYPDLACGPGGSQTITV